MMNQCLGCRAEVVRDLVACKRCWKKIPREIRTRIRHAHQPGALVQSAAWTDAVKEALIVLRGLPQCQDPRAVAE